jgi:uncharacterized membrane-anchored protein YjiN (DUF445 family)
MKEILTLFNSDDKAEIKKSIKDLIVKQVEMDMEAYAVYLIDPSDLQDLVSESLEELKEEIKYEFKDKMRKLMQKKFDELEL